MAGWPGCMPSTSMPKTICVFGVSLICVRGSAEGSVETSSNRRPSSGAGLNSFGKDIENRGAARSGNAHTMMSPTRKRVRIGYIIAMRTHAELSGRYQAAEFVLLGRCGSREASRPGFQIFVAGTGVEQYDSIGAFQEAIGNQPADSSDAGRSLGRGEDAFRGRKLDSAVEHF